MRRALLLSFNMSSSLVAAAAAGDCETVERLLACNIDVNAAADTNGTALEAASLEGHGSVVTLLLGARADVNVADSNGWTALHNAVSSGHLNVSRNLLEARADINATTIDGSTALHLVADADPKVDFKLIAGSDAQGRTSFFAPALVQCLCAAGANVDQASNDGSTPLHEAATVVASSTVLALRSNGANAAAVDKEGRTPLQVVGMRATPTGPSAAETMDRIRSLLCNNTQEGAANSLTAATADNSAAGCATDVPDQPVHVSANHCGDDDKTEEEDEEESLSWSLALDAVRKRLQAQKLHQHDREGQRLSKKRDLLAETLEEDLLFLGLAGGEATSSTSQSVVSKRAKHRWSDEK